MNDRLIHNLNTLHLTDATLDEEDSYHLLTKFLLDKHTYIHYRYPDISLEDFKVLSNNYCVFGAKIHDAETQRDVHSYVPLAVLRYVLHEDMSFSNYYAPRRKDGYIVEAYMWSNGLLYRVREDEDQESKDLEINLVLDPVAVKVLNLKLPDEYRSNDNISS